MNSRAVRRRPALLAAALIVVLAGAESCGPGASAAVQAPVGQAATSQSAKNAAVEQPAADGLVLAALQPGRALLASGTRAVKGLPGFGRNALPALAGEYAYLPAGQKTVPGGAPGSPGAGAEEGILRVAIWFTREPLVYPGEWTTPAEGLKTCTTLPPGISLLGAFELDEGMTLWALGAAGYTLFVSVPVELADPCRFASVFAERFLFFQRYVERPEDSSFPAILEFGR
ncbi:MAG: hypothetical protein A2Y38_10135 [Spirochaetes bacterium GWB1_59_5]|nr:MAG: hypothetical protein A2Y38_10135 [Spirochaetes bacterium GWB1_59_5]